MGTNDIEDDFINNIMWHVKEILDPAHSGKEERFRKAIEELIINKYIVRKFDISELRQKAKIEIKFEDDLL